jgi:RecA/RadA recombinase
MPRVIAMYTNLTTWSEILQVSTVELVVDTDTLLREFEFPRDVLLADDNELRKLFNACENEIQTLKQIIIDFFSHRTRAIDASSILYSKKLPTGIKSLDAALLGGLPCGYVIEIFGTAASGKTLLCLQATALLLSTCPDSTVLFVGTQERFPIERFIELIGGTRQDVLDRLHLQYFLDGESETQFFSHSLPSLMHEFRYGMIIYDGVASNARAILDQFEKARHINEIFGSLRALLRDFCFCCLVTNQIVDVPSDADIDLRRSALGLAVQNNCNIKIMLDYDRNRERRTYKLLKSPYSAPASGAYIVDSLGLRSPAEHDL